MANKEPFILIDIKDGKILRVCSDIDSTILIRDLDVSDSNRSEQRMVTIIDNTRCFSTLSFCHDVESRMLARIIRKEIADIINGE